MGDSSMVVMWVHANDTVLSQRRAPYEVMPTSDTNPPFLATISPSATLVSVHCFAPLHIADGSLFSQLDAEQPQVAFTRPAIPEELQSIIWAFSPTDPSSPDPNAPIGIHFMHGRGQFNLTRTSPPPEDDLAGVSSSPEDAIFMHAILCIAGFLVLLPAGALWARYAKAVHSVHPGWFKFHWYIQAAAGIFIVLGVLVGIRASRSHFDDTHKRLGTFLFSAYALQCAAGTAVHLAETSSRTRALMHMVFGLVIISLSLYQARIGYNHEWVAATGQGVPRLFGPLWYTLILLLPTFFLLVFLFARRRTEHSKAIDIRDDEVAMETRPLRAGEDDDDTGS
ncbi:hypothetical protein BV25DRAFT_1316550 [Artomyces pyxidatus]|uniref:Uncharacterized protein n=1 Tax=Artomyces pyxidatus TaxID=48021 RepID=A0ACB8SPJ6_9AGAM|nr:hypothetical protein BV25DRAFT_1316550 [Artomyces pyxidatus]